MNNGHLAARNEGQESTAAAKSVLQNAEADQNQKAVHGNDGDKVLKVEVDANGLCEEARCVDIDLNTNLEEKEEKKKTVSE